MRVSIVPAQITTVEDKLGGKLSVKQGMLLGVPVLLGFLLAVLFPPSGEFVAYKIVIVSVIFLICGTLAIRIRERIVAEWLVLFATYIARPQFYIFDKNSTYLRPKYEDNVVPEQKSKAAVPQIKKQILIPDIDPNEYTRLQSFTAKGQRGIKYVVGKKGELYVSITENE